MGGRRRFAPNQLRHAENSERLTLTIAWSAAISSDTCARTAAGSSAKVPTTPSGAAEQPAGHGPRVTAR